MIKLQLGLGSVPAEVAMAMFEVMLEQEELIDTGVRCVRCDELTLPAEMHDERHCKECVADLIKIAEEKEAEDIEAIVDIMEGIALINEIQLEIADSIQRDIEAAMLGEIAKSLETMTLTAPNYMRFPF